MRILIVSISISSTHLNKEEISYGRRGTVHRGSTDAREVLRAEVNKKNIAGAHRDIEAAQGGARKM